jgi:GYF domain 2
LDYFISRDGQQYGPYTLADLQRYAASGEVLLTDLATSDALSEPAPVSQIIGTIAVPPTYSVGAPVSNVPMYPDPPNLHWGLVLLFATLSCGIFLVAWELVQAAWLKKVAPQSKAIFIYAAGAVIYVIFLAMSFMNGVNHTEAGYAGIFQLIFGVVDLWGRFSFRSSMEEHYNGPEPMGLMLSGVMTFFFGSIYFQYHINDIVRRKEADRIYAMTR